ncbi:ABC-2 transporter permease [Lysinibacillus sp. KU-BSD001]|uniref:ABC-2 transporter permease n=1 Tax=Lysinibacillus sp. KU-BSD001 TaxID=3141328 RepID=UPI0036EE7C40
MFNLIRKDILVQKTSLMILVPILIAYLMVNDVSSVWLGVIFSTSIIMNAFILDEKSSINNLLNSLPYTRKEIVSSKYMGALIFTFIIVFALFIGNLIIHQEMTDWKEALLVVSVVLMMVSFSFPFSYKYTSKFLVTGALILVVALMVIIKFILPRFGSIIEDKMNVNEKVEWFTQTLFSLQDGQLYAFIVAIVVILYVCSWLLSIRIYSKKAF